MTRTVSPVMLPFAAEHRNTMVLATSSGVDSRPLATWPANPERVRQLRDLLSAALDQPGQLA